MLEPPQVVPVAAVQMRCGGDVAANLETCRRRIVEAAQAGAKLVVLPENFAYFGDEAGRAAVAEPASLDGSIVSALSAAARAAGVAIVAGGMPERSLDPERPYNCAVCIDERGEVVDAYRKIHLFDVQLPDARHRESASASAGVAPTVASLAGLRVGVSICYDVRFPELYRRLVDGGANVLVVSAAFTKPTGEAHWEVLLRARAIESQCWLVAAAQWGDHPNGRTTFGRSMIVDPWGQVAARLDEGEGIVDARVDLGRVDEVRSRLPSLRHRRL